MSKLTLRYNEICVVRLSALGDIMHTIPTVQSLQKKYPKARVTWIVAKRFRSLVDRVPNVNVVTYDETLDGSYERVWKQLKEIKFDVVVACQTNIRASIIVYGLKADRKIGFAESFTRDTQRSFVDEFCKERGSYHVMDTIADFAHHLGAPFIKPTWDVELTEAELSKAKEFAKDRPVVICAPSASSAERNWDTRSFGLILKYLDNHGFHVVIVGGAGELEGRRAYDIWKMGKGRFTNLTGISTIPETLALMKYSVLFVGVDTGPLHMARSQGLPIVGLYAHSNPRRTGPYRRLEGVIDIYTQCAEEEFEVPACDLPWGARLYGEHYMDYITPEMVKDKLDPFIERINPGWLEQRLRAAREYEVEERVFSNVWAQN